MKPNTKVILLLCTGLTLVVFGVAMFFAYPPIMKNSIKEKLKLTEGSEAYGFWKKIPVPIYLKFYFFSIANIDEIYNNFSKPVLEEHGPYTFRESREKVDIYWDENGTLHYREVKTYHFQPDLTNGSLDDVITTVNVPMIAAAATAREKDDMLIYAGLSYLFGETNSQWFVHKRVRQLLFEGYSDELIDKARKYHFDVPYDKFGWFYKRNGSDQGEFSIFTGEDGFHNYAEVNTWNGVKSVDAYEEPCSMINGSAGDLWPPFRKEGGEIAMFVPDICRTIHFSYTEKLVINDLTTFRYVANHTELDNGWTNEANKCFCVKGKCYPPGAVDVSRCKMGAPALVSYPHFLWADSSYTQDVIGMHPDPEKHFMHIDIQKDMGIPMIVAARMQINIILAPAPPLSRFSNFTKTTIYPVLWFSETGVTDDSITDQLKLPVYTIPLVFQVVTCFCVGVGALLVVSAFLLAFMFPPKRRTASTETKEPFTR